MAKSVVGTFVLGGEASQTVSTEVTGTLSEALVGFRQQVMEHLTTHMSGAVEEVDAFGDDEEVEVCEEDSVDEFIKGKKKQKK